MLGSSVDFNMFNWTGKPHYLEHFWLKKKSDFISLRDPGQQRPGNDALRLLQATAGGQVVDFVHHSLESAEIRLWQLLHSGSRPAVRSDTREWCETEGQLCEVNKSEMIPSALCQAVTLSGKGGGGLVLGQRV